MHPDYMLLKTKSGKPLYIKKSEFAAMLPEDHDGILIILRGWKDGFYLSEESYKDILDLIEI